MAVDYSKQYRDHQLEPFFPNELIKMIVSVLVTLAAMVALALLVPEGEEQPADPRATPAHIKPEWYFLAVYQCLKLMPQSFLGISGKLLGVFLQGFIFLVLLSIPFLVRGGEKRKPLFTALVTAGLASFAFLTVWGIWPEDGEGRLEPPSVFLKEHWLLGIMLLGAIAAFALFLEWERRVIKRCWRA